MTAKKANSKKQTKKTTKKAPKTRTVTRTKIVYVKEKREDGMSELARMAIGGATVVGAVSMIPVIGGSISAAMPKTP